MEQVFKGSEQSASSKHFGNPSTRLLDLSEAYGCPICRHGQIEALTLIDAFACNFCHHIFSANIASQSIHVVDSSQPMGWRWNGRNWQNLHQGHTDLTWLVWLGGMILVILPPSLVGLTSYMFPAYVGTGLEQDSRNQWDFSLIWTGLTFGAHLLLAMWLIAEHHQFPPYVLLKVKLRNTFGQWQT